MKINKGRYCEVRLVRLSPGGGDGSTRGNPVFQILFVLSAHEVCSRRANYPSSWTRFRI